MRTLFIYAVIMVVLSSCNGQKGDSVHAHHNTTDSTQYTCSMHPQIILSAPGTCPICGMALLKFSTGNKNNDLMLSDVQMQLANITTRRAAKSRVGETVILNGTFVMDEQKRQAISSRVAGRVEKLFVKESGLFITKGQPLYVFYSEQLLTLQQEYLLAKDQYSALNEKRYKSFLDAAERKLLLYGLTKKQVGEISNENMQTGITFFSPSSGVVTAVNVAEGQYVGEGTLLYNVNDISTIWVEADLYPNDATLVKQGDKVRVAAAALQDNPIETAVDFLSPEFRSNTQILVMRAVIANTDLKFRPGQQAQVFFSHSSHEGIAIPTDAVIRNEKGAHVYVQSGRNTFQPRMVKTGLEGIDQVEITDGLSENDTVAVTGAYLLYSEIILKKGSDPMAGHSH